MHHYLFLFLAFAATNTLANPGNGYPYAVPHPDFKMRALEKRDANGKRDVNAAFQAHQAEYKAFMNVPTNYDEATAAQKQQYEQLKAEAETKAQAARKYAKNWQYHVQQAAAKQKADVPNADCTGITILGQCIDAAAIKDAIAPAPAPASAPAPAAAAPDAAAPAPAPAPADPPPPPAYLNGLYGALGYPYGGGGYGYGGYGGGCYGGGYGGGIPYYGGGYPGSYYGGGYPGYGGGYGGGYPSPFGCSPSGGGVPPGYPKPGKGKTGCDDVKNHGYICNDAFNELSFCFQDPAPYYFGFGAGGGSVGTGSVVVGKCCYFGTCAASDDGSIGYCACSGAGSNA